MTDQIIGIILTSFIVLAVFFLVVSKSFRKSVFNHIKEWMAKKVGMAIIFLIAIVIIVIWLGALNK